MKYSIDSLIMATVCFMIPHGSAPLSWHHPEQNHMEDWQLSPFQVLPFYETDIVKGRSKVL